MALEYVRRFRKTRRAKYCGDSGSGRSRNPFQKCLRRSGGQAIVTRT
jgi:hypothetical protein